MRWWPWSQRSRPAAIQVMTDRAGGSQDTEERRRGGADRRTRGKDAHVVCCEEQRSGWQRAERGESAAAAVAALGEQSSGGGNLRAWGVEAAVEGGDAVGVACPVQDAKPGHLSAGRCRGARSQERVLVHLPTTPAMLSTTPSSFTCPRHGSEGAMASPGSGPMRGRRVHSPPARAPSRTPAAPSCAPTRNAAGEQGEQGEHGERETAAHGSGLGAFRGACGGSGRRRAAGGRGPVGHRGFDRSVWAAVL